MGQTRENKKQTFQLLSEYKQGNLSLLKPFVDLKWLICAKNIDQDYLDVPLIDLTSDNLIDSSPQNIFSDPSLDLEFPFLTLPL